MIGKCLCFATLRAQIPRNKDLTQMAVDAEKIGELKNYEVLLDYNIAYAEETHESLMMSDRSK